MNLSEKRFEYLPLYQQFATHLDDEMPEPPWSDSVGWSTALRRTADLVEPDAITVQGAGPIHADLESGGSDDPTDPQFESAFGPASEEYRETVQIIDDVRSEPVVPVVPGPVSICLEQFQDEWIELLKTDEFAALDTLHAASQLLTDFVRAFGGDIHGLVINEPRLDDGLENGLMLDDALLETGAVFNVAEHYDLHTIGRVPESLASSLSSLAEAYDTVVFEVLSADTLETLDNTQIGGAFPASVWDSEQEAFEADIRSYQAGLPDGFVLMPEMPTSIPPERVRRFRELLE